MREMGAFISLRGIFVRAASSLCHIGVGAVGQSGGSPPVMFPLESTPESVYNKTKHLDAEAAYGVYDRTGGCAEVEDIREACPAVLHRLKNRWGREVQRQVGDSHRDGATGVVRTEKRGVSGGGFAADYAG